ncbi:MAG: hypothetical protein E7324_07775 [Clostridiales bacterium]|nr:hypothetical protein [Clostridiales bacterium]
MGKQEFMAQFSAGMAQEKQMITERMRAYQAQDCVDDAMLERIRLNICDALAAAVKAGERQDTLAAALAFAEKKLQDIPAQWQKNLESAIRHGDERARAIEHIKLDQAGRIRAIFEECREEKL